MRAFTLTALCALCLLVIGCDNGGSGKTGTSGSGTWTGPALQITTTSLPSTYIVSMYNQPITATGGTGTGYTWSVISGSLPTGTTLQTSGTPSTVLSGQVMQATQFFFTVQVEDSFGNKATQALSVNVYPPPPPSSPPVYFGSTVAGRVLFICDASSASTGTPHTDMINELTTAISGLSATDEFDILVYHDVVQGCYESFMGSLVYATSANVTAALNYINGAAMTPAGSADQGAYYSLEASFQGYTNLDTSYFFCCSAPASGSQILNDYPTWQATDPNREQVVICKAQAAATWFQQLAALAGGTYIS